MQLRTWLWWPSVKTHTVAGGTALVTVTVLGMSGMPRFPAFKEFDQIQGTGRSFALWATVILAANACLFLINARGDYLDIRSGRRPISLSFLVLAVAFPCAWGLSILFENGLTFARHSTIDWAYIAKCIFVGEGGLTMVLLFSGLWKPSPQDTLDVIECRRSVCAPLRRLFRGDPPQQPTKEEGERLRVLLASLKDRSAKLATRSLLPADLELAYRLSKSAATVLDSLMIPVAAFLNLRSYDDPALHEAVAFLLEETK
jgi:hypothetical protein